MDKNVIITGFMGTGKTTVGREVARMLSCEFHDTDEIIEARTSMSIADIFKRHGEQYFRELEAVVLSDLARSNQSVIATGGGTLLATGIADIAAKNGIIFCLEADLPALEARLRHNTNRPLLTTDDRRTELQFLSQQREKLYRQLPNHVDTTHLSPREAATIIVSRYQQLTGAATGRK